MKNQLIKNLLLMAESGHAESQFRYAEICLRGIGRQNKKNGLYWLKRASDNGHIEAQYRLGWHYWRFLGKHEKGIVWLKKAALNGHIDARNAVLRLKAEKGDTEAQYQLGLLYLDYKSRMGIFPDKARQWFLKAAEGGHEGAQKILGLNKKSPSVKKRSEGFYSPPKVPLYLSWIKHA